MTRRNKHTIFTEKVPGGPYPDPADGGVFEGEAGEVDADETWVGQLVAGGVEARRREGGREGGSELTTKYVPRQG